MVELKVVKQHEGNVRHQFAITADEPITVEYMETDYGHTLAHVYRGTEIDEHSEPVGVYDSAVDSTGWVVGDSDS